MAILNGSSIAGNPRNSSDFKNAKSLLKVLQPENDSESQYIDFVNALVIPDEFWSAVSRCTSRISCVDSSLDAGISQPWHCLAPRLGAGYIEL